MACGGPKVFVCPISKHCIPLPWVNDGMKDCPDGEDERQLTSVGVTRTPGTGSVMTNNQQLHDRVQVVLLL